MALHVPRYHGFTHEPARYMSVRRVHYVSNRKPRHTPESRKEATRRERLRVKALSQAYDLLQQVIPFDKDTKITYLSILRGAVAYIKALEMILGIREDIFVTKTRRKEREVCSDEKENQEEKVGFICSIKQEDVAWD